MDPRGAALLALGICAYQLSLPSVLFGIHSFTGIGYDDGVYVGAATRLVGRVLPYRDFDFVQPPGITIVMGPVALLGRLIGTRDALAVARCLTVLVTGFNAALAALAVRDRGRVAMVVAGIALALFPLAVAADQTLLLEPYLVCFCLLAVVGLFRGGELAGPRRVLLAGIALGFAGSIKLWAVLPAVAALICCAARLAAGHARTGHWPRPRVRRALPAVLRLRSGHVRPRRRDRPASPRHRCGGVAIHRRAPGDDEWHQRSSVNRCHYGRRDRPFRRSRAGGCVGLCRVVAVPRASTGSSFWPPFS